MRKETASLLGSSVGHIRVVDLIGEGGMGAVFVGFDETLERRVALKVIRSEFRLNSQSKARFLREARILSQLDHPQICTIHDYVEGDENDFLVMELIDGQNLRKALREGLDNDSKMDVAEQLLDVLVEVHGQGVIHRDLKPENIMIMADNQIKVLDFGLSRSVEENVAVTHAETLSPEELTGDTSNESAYVKTALGTIIGTAAYMSPEQARGEPATAASDLYSVGLIFHEIFSEKRPFEDGLEKEELLAMAGRGDTLPVTGLPADLTALVNRLKSLAPSARPSALDAVEQLRWIRDRPKRRLKRLLTTGVLVTLALAVGVMSFQAYRIDQEAKRANLEAETAQRVSEFLVGLFEISDPSKTRGNSVTAREILDSGLSRIEAELKDQPQVRARLMETMGEVYSNLGLYDEAEPLLRTALRLREEQRADHAAELAGVLSKLAKLEAVGKGNLEEAERLLRSAIKIDEEAAPSDSPQLALHLSRLSIVLRAKGANSEARIHAERAVNIQEGVFGSDSGRLGTYLGNLATIHWAEGDYTEAEALFRRALTIKEKTDGPDDPSSSFLLHNLALVYQDIGDHVQAETMYERALTLDEKILGPDHPDVAVTLSNLGNLLLSRGKDEEAESLLERALSIQEHALEPDHLDLAFTVTSLADVHLHQDRLDEAETEFRRALRIAGSKPLTGPGTSFSVKVNSLWGLAQIQQRLGADQQLTDIWSEVVQTVEPHADEVGEEDLALLVQALVELGRTDQANAAAAEFLAGGYENEKLKDLRRDLVLPPAKQ